MFSSTNIPGANSPLRVDSQQYQRIVTQFDKLGKNYFNTIYFQESVNGYIPTLGQSGTIWGRSNIHNVSLIRKVCDFFVSNRSAILLINDLSKSQIINPVKHLEKPFKRLKKAANNILNTGDVHVKKEANEIINECNQLLIFLKQVVIHSDTIEKKKQEIIGEAELQLKVTDTHPEFLTLQEELIRTSASLKSICKQIEIIDNFNIDFEEASSSLQETLIKLQNEERMLQRVLQIKTKIESK